MLEVLLILATLMGGATGVSYFCFWGKIVPRYEPSVPRSNGGGTSEKWVDLKYREYSGLQRELEAQGYAVRWSSDEKTSRRIELEGWEVVKVRDGKKNTVILKVRGRPTNLTLIRKREN